MKSLIVEHLGETGVLLPNLVAEGLAANDRAKVRMSALQAAAHRAGSPAGTSIDLGSECRAAGVDPVDIRVLVSGAKFTIGDVISAPGLKPLTEALAQDLRTMIRAVQNGSAEEGEAASGRMAALASQLALSETGEMTRAQIVRLTAISGIDGDSVHRLVMDLHKALNRLAAGCAEESVAGARAFGLSVEDRHVLEAFMRGIESTRALKFDHPGLDTTATRVDQRLVIQNDIGTTDAHVLVVSVEGNSATVTYTDVHRPRAKFFVSMFDGFSAHWSGLERDRADELEESVFYLVTGRLDADNTGRRDAFITAVGAALVFLIDWNKARKALRPLAGKADAIQILEWAARQRLGHRAFLELGGTELVASAIRHAAPARIGFGERLDIVLGKEGAITFLKSVLRICAQSLLEGRSIRLARDAVAAEFLQRLGRGDNALLATIVRQLGLARDIAAQIAQHVADLHAGRPVDGASLTERAKRIEEKADRIALDARNEVARLNAHPVVGRLSNAAEDTIDDLEQAAFIASLLPKTVPGDILQPVLDLCRHAVRGSEAAASGVDAAAEVPEGHRADSDHALAATTHLTDIEHAADAAERAATACVLRGDCDPRAALPVLELARALERATDHLAGLGHLLQQHVMADLAA